MLRYSMFLISNTIVFLALFSSTALSQTSNVLESSPTTDSSNFERSNTKPTQPILDHATPSTPPHPLPLPADSAHDVKFYVNKIKILGSTVYSDEQMQALAKPYEGRQLTLAELRSLADQITQRYIQDGYISSFATVLAQEIDEEQGTTIQVYEGKLSAILIENLDHLSKHYVCSRLTEGLALNEDKPLNVKALDDRLQLLKRDPFFKDVSATLRPAADATGIKKAETNPTSTVVPVTPQSDGTQSAGTQANGAAKSSENAAQNETHQWEVCNSKEYSNIDVKPPLDPQNDSRSVLVVTLKESRPVEVGAGFDNFAPESIGAQRSRLDFTLRNPTYVGLGDSLGFSWNRTLEGGSNVYRFGYTVPFNAKNGTVSFQAAIERNHVIQKPFDTFNITGKSERYSLQVRQPLVRTPNDEFAISSGFAFRTSQTFLSDQGTAFLQGPDAKGRIRLSTFNIGQDYVHRDQSGAWLFSSQLNIGTGLFGATTHTGSVPDSRYVSLNNQIQRLQRIDSRNLLLASLDTQFSTDPLLSPEQFVIGGGDSVRGYRENARTGDNGLRFSVEHRWTAMQNQAGNPIVQLGPFVDLGWVWNHAKNPNPQQNDRFLAGAGLGVLLQPIDGFNLRFNYGIPIAPLKQNDGTSDRGKDSLQRNGLYFDCSYRY